VVTFSSPGFFPYRCMRHSTADDGDGMSGVVWVQ
jgi:plastocyanin